MTWTRLTACYAKNRVVVRLRFGRPGLIRWEAPNVTHYWFRPGELFGIVWWARLSPRRQIACFAVAEAIDIGQQGHVLPGIHPAVRVHAFLVARPVRDDRRAVDRADALIGRIERAGIEPEDVPASYYRAAGQSLRVGREPRKLERAALRRFRRSTCHAS